MNRERKVDETRHAYNVTVPDEDLSYKSETTVTEDESPPEPGPPEEFGTARPHSRQ